MQKFVSLLLILLASIILWKCANQTTPTGGPKDENPPIVKKSNPINNQTNYKGNTVELTFDELIQLNNPKEQIIITPSPGKDITFTTKQTKVLITPKEGWKDSTTYSINFREGVEDVNEKNPAVNLHLAFSTGPTIDSLQIIGKVVESLTEKVPENITIALYQQDTFDIFKHAPSYFTKTAKNGSFIVENLKAGLYYIYAFDDKNKNLKVDSKNEKFGFLSEPIPSKPKPTKRIRDTLTIALYQIDSRPIKISSIRNTGTISQIKFNKELFNYSIINPTNKKLYHNFGDKQSDINIYHQLPLNDSLQLSIHATDSLSQNIDSTFFIKHIASKVPPDKFASKIISATLNPETYKVQVQVSFSKPIKSINIDSIYITDIVTERKSKKKEAADKVKNLVKKATTENKTDSSKIKKITTEIKLDSNKRISIKDKPDTLAKNIQSKKDTIAKVTVKPVVVRIEYKDIKIDTIKKLLQISTILDKKLFSTKTKELNIVLEESSMITIENDSSKREIKSIPIITTQTEGILHIEVLTQHKNFEVELLTSNGEIVRTIRNTKKHTFKYLPPQEYKIRCYIDINNNSLWDAQNILQRKESEPTYFYKSEDKYVFPIRSTWEVGPLLLKF